VGCTIFTLYVVLLNRWWPLAATKYSGSEIFYSRRATEEGRSKPITDRIRLFLAINRYCKDDVAALASKVVLRILSLYSTESLRYHLETVAIPIFFGTSDQASCCHFWCNRMEWKHTMHYGGLKLKHGSSQPFLTKSTAKSHRKRPKITWWLHTTRHQQKMPNAHGIWTGTFFIHEQKIIN
jgi:hypothetical protein